MSKRKCYAEREQSAPRYLHTPKPNAFLPRFLFISLLYWLGWCSFKMILWVFNQYKHTKTINPNPKLSKSDADYVIEAKNSKPIHAIHFLVYITTPKSLEKCINFDHTICCILFFHLFDHELIMYKIFR